MNQQTREEKLQKIALASGIAKCCSAGLFIVPILTAIYFWYRLIGTVTWTGGMVLFPLLFAISIGGMVLASDYATVKQKELESANNANDSEKKCAEFSFTNKAVNVKITAAEKEKGKIQVRDKADAEKACEEKQS